MNPAFVSAIAASAYRRQRTAEVPALTRKNIQPKESSCKSRSSTINACGSRKEEEEETFGYCFSLRDFEVKEWFSKRQHKPIKCFENLPIYPKKRAEVNYLGIFLLPDDILEMCLNRLPHTSLKNARLVCKKWSFLIVERRLLQIRKECRYQNLWLFVFGTIQYDDDPTRNNNKIHALDLSNNKWHVIDADFLKGRFRFSVAGIHNGICIVGGSSENKKPRKHYPGGIVIRKIHKEVMLFNAITKSCHKLQSMKYARCVPILGVVTDHSIIPYTRRRRTSYHSSSKRIKRPFLLIAVGGFNDQSSLDSGEMYDSLTNKWIEIQTLPSDFGHPFSGIVCGKMFYVISTTLKLAAYDIEKGFWFALQTSSFPPKPTIYILPKLVSSNGRLYMVSNCYPKIQQGYLVTTLWELDFMHLTWTEISTDPYGNIDWSHSTNFAANRNLIFGIHTIESRGENFEISDHFSICECDMSASHMAKWSNISTNFVANLYLSYPLWIRNMVVTHVNI